MSKLTEGTRVVSIEGNSLRNGTIKNLHESVGVAIVDFDDGKTEKIWISNLAVAPDPIKAEKEDTAEFEEKPEITITPDEFKNITTKIVAEESKKGGPLVSMFGAILLAKIHEALFGIKND